MRVILLLAALTGLEGNGDPMDLLRNGTVKEEEVPAYELPELMRFADGSPVHGIADWERRRREILDLFQEHVYGSDLPVPDDLAFTVLESGPAYDGLGIRKQVEIRFANGQPQPFRMGLLLYLPAGVPRAPAILILNFNGNHTITPDPAVLISPRQLDDPAAGEAARGSRVSRFPVAYCLEKGVAVATLWRDAIDPDDGDDSFSNGIHPYFPGTPGAPATFGAISAWAWGLSRALDYLETEAAVDARRVVVAGHSRLGKAALWAGASDPRFAAVVSNDSGCNGAALSRRCFGETVHAINERFPHWFCRKHREYGLRVNDLPVDQHMLIACVAPRPAYIASASLDLWADPVGEFLAARLASPAWEIHGLAGLPVTAMPPVNAPVAGNVSYHIREGRHDLTLFDWQQYVELALRLGR